MTNTKLTLVLVFVSTLLVAQEKYIPIEEIQWKNSTERTYVTQLFETDPNLVFGFLSISPEDSANYLIWEKQLEQAISELKGRKVVKKKDKDLKNIYDFLHSRFLKRYEEEAYFDDIFKNGYYNCVTAVALYAFTFHELEIPYTIKETPTHVYIVAYPKDLQLLIETTDPVGGFKTFSPGFKENYVNVLLQAKRVERREVNTYGINGTFDKYYFGGDDLDIKELIGVQFYNKGIFCLTKNKTMEGFNELAKAQLFYSNQQLDETLYHSLVSLLGLNDYEDWEEIKLLPLLGLFRDFGVTQKTVIDEFNRMIYSILTERGDEKLAENAFDYFQKNETDSLIKLETTYAYFYEKSRIAYNRARYNDALKFVRTAYKLKPTNINAEDLLVSAFAFAYQNGKIEDAMQMMVELKDGIPTLMRNNRFVSILLNLYLLQMGKSYEQQKPVAGEAMKDNFELQVEKSTGVIFDQNILGNAYSEAAVYYFKKGYASKAKAIIRKGLEYSPDNYELKTRLKMLSY